MLCMWEHILIYKIKYAEEKNVGGEEISHQSYNKNSTHNPIIVST